MVCICTYTHTRMRSHELRYEVYRQNSCGRASRGAIVLCSERRRRIEKQLTLTRKRGTLGTHPSIPHTRTNNTIPPKRTSWPQCKRRHCTRIKCTHGHIYIHITRAPHVRQQPRTHTHRLVHWSNAIPSRNLFDFAHTHTHTTKRVHTTVNKQPHMQLRIAHTVLVHFIPL